MNILNSSSGLGFTLAFSLWTRPSDPRDGSERRADLRRDAFGFASPRAHLLSWIYAAHQASKLPGRQEAVRVITDAHGAAILGELDLPVTFSTDLEALDAPSALWVAGKLRACQLLASAGTPFLHLDGDVYLHALPPCAICGLPALLVQDEETPGNVSWYADNYVAPRAELARLGIAEPASWRHAPARALSCGLVGGTDTATIGAAASTALDLITRYRDELERLGPRGSELVYLLEQFNLLAEAHARGVTPTLLLRSLPPEQRCYQHLMGDKGRLDIEARLERRVADLAPASLRQLDRLLAGYARQATRPGRLSRSVVISLSRRQDRRAEFAARVADPAVGWPDHLLPRPEVVRGVDGASGVVPTPFWWKQGGGAYGCLQSHLRVLEDALMDGVETLAVFEDDAVFAPCFGRQLETFLAAVPADWQVLFLGGQHHAPPELLIGVPSAVRCRNTQRTHAYVLRGKEVMQSLYTLWTEYAHRNPGRDWHIDWVMGPWCSTVRAYAPDRFLVSQGRSQSDINGRLNPPRSWNPPSRTAPVLWLTCSREEAEAKTVRGEVHLGFDRDEQGRDRGLVEAFAQRSVNSQVTRLRRWGDELQSEVEAGLPGAVVALWHPESLTFAAAIREAFRGRLQLAEGHPSQVRLAICRECEMAGAEGADGQSVHCMACPTCNGRGRNLDLLNDRCPQGHWE